MELRHLRYFVVVAEELHFGRAAQRLYIAQPPLSQQIQQLERELGVALFIRTSRQVRLTAAGQTLFEEARRILSQVDQAVERTQRAHHGEFGRLGVGFVASATYDILPDILREFRTRFAGVELDLIEMPSAAQAQALRDKRVDVAFSRPALEDKALIIEPVVTEPLVAALPAAHPFAAQSELPLSAFADQDFVLFPQFPKPSYADSIIEICERAGFRPRVAQETLQMQTALSLVAAGIGVTIVPASVRNLSRIGVVYRPFAAPTPTTELSIAYRRDDLSPILANFLRLVREFAVGQKTAAPLIDATG